MMKTLSASWIGLFVAVPLIAAASAANENRQVKDQVLETREVSEQTEPPEGFDEFFEDVSSQLPTEDDLNAAADWLRAVSDETKKNMPAATAATDRLLNEVSASAGGQPDEDFMARARAAVQQGAERSGQPGANVEPMFALITLGMGPTAILNYIREAEGMATPVIFVFRGFDSKEGGIQSMVEEILAVNEFEIPFEAHINPVMFRQTDAERGPVFIYTGDDGVPRIRRGQVNLTSALESASSGPMDLVVGETTEIREPDLLSIIEEKIEDFDGTEHVAAAKERAQEQMLRSSVQLPMSTTNQSYLVDPTIHLNEDITLPDGRIVAHRGATINPLEFSPWQVQVVVFDSTSPWQVEQAARWAAEGKHVTKFITTELPSDSEDRRRLGETLGEHVYLVDELVAQRMDLRVVPSLVVQDGLMVRVYTAAQDN